MKMVAFNGSPNKEGNTFLAIKMVSAELEREGIETEVRAGPRFSDSVLRWIAAH